MKFESVQRNISKKRIHIVSNQIFSPQIFFTILIFTWKRRKNLIARVDSICISTVKFVFILHTLIENVRKQISYIKNIQSNYGFHINLKLAIENSD